MDMYVIEGGRSLRGTVTISGSKNATLPLMAAALLAETPTVLENVPDLRDIRSMIDLLEHLNARVVFKNGRMVIDPRDFDTPWVPYEVMKTMRASMYAFGPMVARHRRSAVSMPGGCNIGQRPVDLHLRGLEALGVRMNQRGGYVHAQHSGLLGAELNLLGQYGPSVGATCNVLMAACLAQGTTTIRNAACEPDVQELCRFLNAMGAQIDGIGTNTLRIHGVTRLRGTKWRVPPDRIEAATFAVAALITNGDLVLQNVEAHAMESTLAALQEWGASITAMSGCSLRIHRAEARLMAPLELRTAPFPGLPTDVQPALVALLGITPGVSRIEETIYPDRFMYIHELNRLGACMRQTGNAVIVRGVERYEGASVMSSDLRAGAALTLAALAADGESQVRRVYHIERGYERFEQKLAAIGANIKRQKESAEDPGLIAFLAGQEQASVSSHEDVQTQA